MKQKLIYLILLVICISGCFSKQYIHISHTRTTTNNKVDSLAQTIDYALYDIRMLGGDMTFTTSMDSTSMNHVDSVFNVKHPNTLWALGNHDDIRGHKIITEYTKREPYYHKTINHIKFIVLWTQDSANYFSKKQMDMFNQALDDSKNCTHIILLSHKMPWIVNHPELHDNFNKIANGRIGDCYYCHGENNFYTDIYPKLVDKQKEGKKVLCIGGDLGHRSKKFEYKTSENIWFLASGIKSRSKDNQVLILNHNTFNDKLNWHFSQLDSLPKK